jgi:hypothetical protein
MLIRWIHRVFQYLRRCCGREEFATAASNDFNYASISLSEFQFRR